jgi:hypothetical protein
MLDKKIKKAILETKDNKERLLIEENLVKTRIFTIVESQEIIENFQFLPEGKKMKIALNLMEEIRFLDENKILNEQLMDYLGKLFGNQGLSSIVQTIVEPLVNSILSGIGIPDGFIKNTLISLFTSNPLELSRALKSCEALTKLVAESMVEGLVMMIKQQQGLEGKGYTIIRNLLGGAIKDTKFVQGLESQLTGIVCEIYRNFNKKASDVYTKLTPEVTT